MNIWLQLEQKGGGGPGARSSHAIAVVGHKVYAFGGEFSPRVPVDNQLHVFNLPDQTWSVIADAKGDTPPPRVGVTMASIGHTIYVFGGRDATHKELDDLYSFDTLTTTWTHHRRLSGPGPPHRSYHSMTADHTAGRVYVFGGCGNAGRLNDLWAYDVVDNKWIQFPLPAGEDSCKPRGGPGLAAVDGKIWVVYGFSGVELDDVHCFDPNPNGGGGRWVEVETKGDKPTPRSVFSTLVLGKYIFICGGEIDPSDLGHLGAGKFSQDVFALDTDTLVWKRLEDAGSAGPSPRGWSAFAAAGEEAGLLVYGGNSPTNERLDDIFFFTPTFV